MESIIDIAFGEFGDGGDISLNANNDVAIIHGLFNQVYLALFGGNVEQSTTERLDEVTDRKDWWGNAYIPIDQQFNSSYERALTENNLTSFGISRIVEAAKNDLNYLKAYADIKVTGSIIERNIFKLSVTLSQPNSQSPKITFIWDGTKNELIQYQTI